MDGRQYYKRKYTAFDGVLQIARTAVARSSSGISGQYTCIGQCRVHIFHLLQQHARHEGYPGRTNIWAVQMYWAVQAPHLLTYCDHTLVIRDIRAVHIYGQHTNLAVQMYWAVQALTFSLITIARSSSGVSGQYIYMGSRNILCNTGPSPSH